MNHSIDILLATYNGEKYLVEQIESILLQTILNWILLIRDDGSTDGTLQIIQRYADQYPDKIIWLRDNESNLGVTKNFERLMEYSTASYIMFCDQDDIWLPHKIETCLRKLQTMEREYGVDTPLLVYTDLSVCDERGELVAESFWKYQGSNPSLPLDYAKALVQNNATGSTFIFNRSLCDRALPFPPDTVMHDWCVALTALYLGKIDYITNQTILYRQHSANVSGSKGKNILPILRKLPRYCIILENNRVQAKSFLENFRSQLDSSPILITTFGFFACRLCKNW
ncbi:MAG: glycosyltransferase family 2 protein [Sulfuricurvum sp.]|nr:glycosyltransferase family 2 protein [Sulfuricurvum sp.]